MTQDSEQLLLEEMPITKHLIILRGHLFKIVGLILIVVLLFIAFCAIIATKCYLNHLRAQLPVSSSMIATDVTATFMAPFKLNFFVALMLAMPFMIYQLWAFVKPALYEKEKSLATPLLIGSIALFYAGVAFAYFIALPSILHFFISVSPDTVAPMTDINSYLSFCLKLFLVFGLTFEIPIITLSTHFNWGGEYTTIG